MIDVAPRNAASDNPMLCGLELLKLSVIALPLQLLYALRLGFGADPLDEHELAFVYERDLRAVPSMAAVLCHLGPWIGDPRTGATRAKVVHGEQRMFFHAFEFWKDGDVVSFQTFVRDRGKKVLDNGRALVR